MGVWPGRCYRAPPKAMRVWKQPHPLPERLVLCRGYVSTSHAPALTPRAKDNSLFLFKEKPWQIYLDFEVCPDQLHPSCPHSIHCLFLLIIFRACISIWKIWICFAGFLLMCLRWHLFGCNVLSSSAFITFIQSSLRALFRGRPRPHGKPCEGRDLGLVYHWDSHPRVYLVLNKCLKMNKFYQPSGGFLIIGSVFYAFFQKFKRCFVCSVIFFSNKKKRPSRTRIKPSILAESKWHNRKWSVVIYFNRTYYTVDFRLKQRIWKWTDKPRAGGDV